MFQDTSSLAAMAEALSQSPDYRVLRRLVARLPFTPSSDQETKTAVILDTETTGLDAQRNEIIELGMVKFDYTPNGNIVGVRDTFSAFNEPIDPIPADITDLTGISDELVAGHRIDAVAVEKFVDDAVLIIAHHSQFDRGFAERYWPVFAQKAWACSATEIEWRKYGFEGAKLGYLLHGAGYFHQAHRAVDDCNALLEILAFELPTIGRPALALLLENARKRTVRVWAEQSPFELKNRLKTRGYRWSDGSDGRPRSWFVDVCEAALDDEIAFLKTEIYLRDVEPRTQTLTAFTRFSARV
ncbi:3'-5' exonuclease [Bradyrhizobium sp. 160]|uniref:3'-5' exonuclease n=1 Tax=Bradyrhizobium sp. 160 TaxID=2782634 RepID=UPI001FFB572B|nr:3'-5' exonuclease [Bradyrhizobium sp. 160]MCK1627520.1 3'-5' exonuclease [Bradyrhizobium sp. 160]